MKNTKEEKLKKKIIIHDGYKTVVETEATFLIDKSKLVHSQSGKVGYEIYVEIDRKHYPVHWNANGFYIEFIGMTAEGWFKYGWNNLIK